MQNPVSDSSKLNYYFSSVPVSKSGPNSGVPMDAGILKASQKIECMIIP